MSQDTLPTWNYVDSDANSVIKHEFWKAYVKAMYVTVTTRVYQVCDYDNSGIQI